MKKQEILAMIEEMRNIEEALMNADMQDAGEQEELQTALQTLEYKLAFKFSDYLEEQGDNYKLMKVMEYVDIHEEYPTDLIEEYLQD